jgi:serine/threonine-protein kinase HipA
MTTKCLFCYQPIEKLELDFHQGCSKKIFGETVPPVLPYSEDQLELLAEEIIKSQTTVTGVQPKLSLHLISTDKSNTTKRFTIVGLWGGYILKPPTPNYPQLPEVEDLTMHLAGIAKIKVVPHCLIRLQSGNLAFITRRIDRVKKSKIHMEDMCQLSEKLTENKYQGSYEQIARIIQKFSVNPGLDVVNFFELVLFSFLTGNADMHLKNFSLIHQPLLGPVLAPAYDLVATSLVNPADDEEMALTLNGKKRKIRKSDFIAAFNTLKLEQKKQMNILNKMFRVKQAWIEKVNISFLSDDFKSRYIELINNRFDSIS